MQNLEINFHYNVYTVIIFFINQNIEFDGEQHFIPTYFGKKKDKTPELINELAQKSFAKIKYRDSLKTTYCTNRNITLLRIRYDELIELTLQNNLLI